MGAIPSTTLGYEKLFNPAFQLFNEAEFVRWLLAAQPEAPRYFAEMKRVNKAGPTLLSTLPQPQQLLRTALDLALEAGELVIDLRPRDDYAQSHVPGTVSVPATNRTFSTYVGWLVDYQRPEKAAPPGSSYRHTRDTRRCPHRAG